MIAIYMYKTNKYPLEFGFPQLVAKYVGRPLKDQIKFQSKMLYLLAKFYNARVTHENDRSGSSIRNFFISKNAFGRLLKPPANIVEQHIPNSATLTRKSGHSMSSKTMKEIGVMYTNKWLESVVAISDEGKELTNLDLIKDIALLQEMQQYNFDGNFDRVSALFGITIQVEELKQIEVRSSEKLGEHISFFKETARRMFGGKSSYERQKGSYITDSRLNNSKYIR